MADNPDKAALDLLHAQAVIAAAAKARGDMEAYNQAKAQMAQIGAVYGGFTDAELSTALAQADAAADPFGLKTVGQAGIALAVVAGLWWLASRSRGQSRRSLW